MKSLDSKTWKAVIHGWEAPVTVDDKGAVTGPKSEKDWSPTEDEASLGNSRALNAIFNGVDKNVFRLINTCTSAKEAWEILVVAYEGTTKVREQKLQYITTNFEALTMFEDESVADFNVRIRDLANESYSLGKPMTDEDLVRKTLRALSPRFKMKITAIEEVHDLKKLKFDELMGSLTTFELSLPKIEKKHKGVALKSSILDQKEQVYSDSDNEIDDTIAMLAKNYGRVMKRFSQVTGKNVPQDVADDFKQKFQKNGNLYWQVSAKVFLASFRFFQIASLVTLLHDILARMGKKTLDKLPGLYNCYKSPALPL